MLHGNLTSNELLVDWGTMVHMHGETVNTFIGKGWSVFSTLLVGQGNWIHMTTIPLIHPQVSGDWYHAQTKIQPSLNPPPPPKSTQLLRPIDNQPP